MLYPTIHLNDATGLDVGPNKTPLTKFGSGSLTHDNDLLVTLNPPFYVEGQSLVRAELSERSLSKLSLEIRCLVTTTAVNNALLSNEGFSTEVGQYSVRMNKDTIKLYYQLSDTEVEHYWCEIPTEDKGKWNVYTIALDHPTWKFYVNGVQIGQVVMNQPITDSTILLLGSVDHLYRYRSPFLGVIDYVKVYDGYVVPAGYISEKPLTLDRTEVLSYFPNDPTFKYQGVNETIFGSFSSTAAEFRAESNDGLLFSTPKVPGVGTGKSLAQLVVDSNNFLSAIYSDLSTDVLGEIPSVETAGTWPPGSGYLIDDSGTKKYVPMSPSSHAQLVETDTEYTLTTAVVGNPPLDYASKVSILQQSYVSDIFQAASTANTWQEVVFNDIIAADSSRYSKSGNGRLVLEPGTYFVEGYITTPLSGTVMARLAKVSDNGTLIKSEVGYGTGGSRFTRRLRMHSTITLLESTELKVEYASNQATSFTANSAITIKGRVHHSELNFYKVG